MSVASCVRVPRVLLPTASVDVHRWAVIACDQYTSQPEYWAQVEEIVGQAPLEVIVRSKAVFDFMEPVRLEVRVRNTSPLEIPIDGRL